MLLAVTPSSLCLTITVKRKPLMDVCVYVCVRVQCIANVFPVSCRCVIAVVVVVVTV